MVFHEGLDVAPSGFEYVEVFMLGEWTRIYRGVHISHLYSFYIQHSKGWLISLDSWNSWMSYVEKSIQSLEESPSESLKKLDKILWIQVFQKEEKFNSTPLLEASYPLCRLFHSDTTQLVSELVFLQGSIGLEEKIQEDQDGWSVSCWRNVDIKTPKIQWQRLPLLGNQDEVVLAIQRMAHLADRGTWRFHDCRCRW